MIRRATLFLVLSLSGIAASTILFAGEPGPGLEVTDPDGTVHFTPPDLPPPVGATGPIIPPADPRSTALEPLSTAVPEYYPPAPAAPEEPYYGGPGPGEPFPTYSDPTYADPTYTDPAPAYSGEEVGQPYAGESGGPLVAPAGGGLAPLSGGPAEAGPLPASPVVSPYPSIFERFDARNRNYPGLGDAASRRDLKMAADIVWKSLRERRIVNTALVRGPGSSGDPISNYDVQMVFAAINPGTSEAIINDPRQAGYRIDLITDSFQQSVLDDYNYGMNFDAALLRLHADLDIVASGMDRAADDVLYQELARVWFKAVKMCDFFAFPRQEVARRFSAIMRNAGTTFLPDGASIGGDVGGVTANIFHSLLYMTDVNRSTRWLDREVDSAWRVLDHPIRYLQALALPDRSLPRFGPRSGWELAPSEVETLKSLLNDRSPGKKPSGLSETASFPAFSNAKSYGGIFVSRSGHDAAARYMAVRFGFLGYLPGAPGHLDFGSIVLAARGTRFVVDAGGFGGAAAEAASHNVISVAGNFGEMTSYNDGGSPVDAVWRTNAGIDYAADALAIAGGRSWQREMLYVKNIPGEDRYDYWLVLDRVGTSGSTQPAQGLIRFQLAPGIQAYTDGNGVMASAGFGSGPSLRIFPVDSVSRMSVTEGDFGQVRSFSFDAAGMAYPASSVVVEREIVGDTDIATLFYPGESSEHKPVRVERDSDLIRGRTGAVVVDHGNDKIDVIAWAPPSAELVTPTLNLQMAADMAVFRLRKGKIVRVCFVNLERFQAKEPNGGQWSMKVEGPPTTLMLEPSGQGGWLVLSDPANAGGATLTDINLGPAIGGRRLGIRPGETRLIDR